MLLVRRGLLVSRLHERMLLMLWNTNQQKGFTRALAAESAEKGIRANVIFPGYIETDMTAGAFS